MLTVSSAVHHQFTFRPLCGIAHYATVHSNRGEG